MKDPHRKPKLLLACCCGPCTTAALELLAPDYDITLNFWGSNLDTLDEYNARLGALTAVNNALNSGKPMIVEPYSPKDFMSAVTKELAGVPEGGSRCALCFEKRLTAAAKAALREGSDCFATTLTTGPRKNAAMINEIGERAARLCSIKFLSLDLKKNGGFQRSVDISKALNIYRQRYCGCAFSKPKTQTAPLQK